MFDTVEYTIWPSNKSCCHRFVFMSTIFTLWLQQISLQLTHDRNVLLKHTAHNELPVWHLIGLNKYESSQLIYVHLKKGT